MPQFDFYSFYPHSFFIVIIFFFFYFFLLKYYLITVSETRKIRIKLKKKAINFKQENISFLFKKIF